MKLDDANNIIQQFKNCSFKKRVSNLEKNLVGKDKNDCKSILSDEVIDSSLLLASFIVKRASSQINEVVHAVGILISLPYILRDGEMIQSLSLAAGNTGKPFDLETNFRIAEYKFIDWKGGPESIRQNQFFKDFYFLAEYETPKEKYLYTVGVEYPLKFLAGGRSINSVISHNSKLKSKFQSQFGNSFSKVNDYYSLRKNNVDVIDLKEITPFFHEEKEEIGFDKIINTFH